MFGAQLATATDATVRRGPRRGPCRLPMLPHACARGGAVDGCWRCRAPVRRVEGHALTLRAGAHACPAAGVQANEHAMRSKTLHAGECESVSAACLHKLRNSMWQSSSSLGQDGAQLVGQAGAKQWSGSTAAPVRAWNSAAAKASEQSGHHRDLQTMHILLQCSARTWRASDKSRRATTARLNVTAVILPHGTPLVRRCLPAQARVNGPEGFPCHCMRVRAWPPRLQGACLSEKQWRTYSAFGITASAAARILQPLKRASGCQARAGAVSR